MSSPLEKSKDCLIRYEGNEDPWGNRERKLYQKIFKKATELAYEHVNPRLDNKVYIFDIGCGGGNVLDVWIENSEAAKYSLDLKGCDISPDAIKFLNDRYPTGKFDLIDLEEYHSPWQKDTVLPTNLIDDFSKHISEADIISIVDVMYYFGAKRDYKDTLDEIWKSIKKGAIVVVADNLVRAFRRDYLTKKEDAQLLESFTDYTEKICEEVSDSGKRWNRYLKVRIIKKL